MTGVTTDTIQVLSNTCSVPWTLPLPGGIRRPTKIATSGVATALSTSHATTTRRPWFVESVGRRGAAAGSAATLRPHVEKAVHVADRLHRAAEAVDPARRAGDKALPAEVTALGGRVERERDRPVRVRQRARREAALILGVVGHAGSRGDDPERRHGERVRCVVRVDVVGRL